jgi:hypothetical protein
MNTNNKLVAKLCGEARALDRLLSDFGVSFLSNEGRILCSVVANSGSNIKVVTTADDVSLRSASMALDKIIKTELAYKIVSDTDRRSYAIYFNVMKITSHYDKHFEIAN